MDYEKLHKDTITKLQEMVNSGKITVEIARGICADFIPENEDERIRKEMLIFFKNFSENGTWKHIRDVGEWIAWLEKQESVGEIVPRCKTSWYNEGKIQGQIEGLSDDEKYQQGWHDALEKQSEQKPDKVEPKFKVGDWITDGNITIQIEAIKNNCYLYCEDCALYSIKTADKVYHLWTIQDAKKGDILQANKCTLIFDSLTKDIDGNTVVSSWYHCDTKTFYGMGTSEPDLWVSTNIVPATKEQRDLLFQKMKEAGYEWNADKKELKKIEQKQVIDYPDSLPKDNWELIREFITKFGRIPKDEDELNILVQYVLKRQKPAWSEEDKLHIRELESLVKRVWVTAERENDKDTIRKMRDLSFFLKTLKPQLKQEWSKEDERILSNINLYIRKAREFLHFGKENIEEADNWLKSLKDRCLPQPEQEWSEDDERLFQIIIDILDREEHLGHISHTDLIACVRRLKSLKPQSKQEWNEEDEQYLLVCKNALAKYQITDKWDAHIIFHWLENKLKSLRPQNTWKPTEEQMMCLDSAIREYQSEGYPAKTLESLYEQLKAIGGE